MKNMIFKASMLLLAAGLSTVARAQTAAYEYWLDDRFEQRTTGSGGNGQIQLTVDASDLLPGIHRYHFRARDAKNRWSSPLCRYFLRVGPDYTQSRPAAYEFRVDNGVPVQGAMQGNTLELALDMGSLLPGIHTLTLRTADDAGRWSSPTAHYFLRVGRDLTGNAPQQYEYWIDGDYEGRQAGTMTDATISLSADVSRLILGMHRFQFRIQDKAGRWSAPQARYFVRTEKLPDDNAVTAYEYWFNAGSVRRVEVGPANPYRTGDLWIDIDDLLPNTVAEDYTMDWENRTAYCPDDVVFGIRFADAAGNHTPARCDTFAYNVPQQLAPVPLENDEPETILRPEAGRLYAYTVSASRGDSLLWSASGPCRIDLYGPQGERLQRWASAGGPLERKMEAAEDGTLTALIYSIGVDTLEVACHRWNATALARTEAGDGIRITRQAGAVVVRGAGGMSATVCHVQGYVAEQRRNLTDTETFRLERGVYLIRLTDGHAVQKTVKISVP